GPGVSPRRRFTRPRPRCSPFARRRDPTKRRRSRKHAAPRPPPTRNPREGEGAAAGKGRGPTRRWFRKGLVSSFAVSRAENSRLSALRVLPRLLKSSLVRVQLDAEQLATDEDVVAVRELAVGLEAHVGAVAAAEVREEVVPFSFFDAAVLGGHVD